MEGGRGEREGMMEGGREEGGERREGGGSEVGERREEDGNVPLGHIFMCICKLYTYNGTCQNAILQQL